MRLLKAVFVCLFLCSALPLFAQATDNYLQTAKHYFLNAKPRQALDILASRKEKGWLDYLYLGLIYEELKDTQAALSNYQQSLALQPNSIALFRTAKIYRANKQYEEAKRFFSRVLEFDSSIRLAHYYLGDCLLRMGDYQKAYVALSKAAAFYPDSSLVQKEFAEVKAALGEDFFKQKKQQKEEERKAMRLPFYVRQKNIPMVRVGLATDIDDFSFSCAGEFRISDAKHSFSAKAQTFYTVVFSGETIVLKDYQDKQELERFASPVSIEAVPRGDQLGAFYVLDVTYGKNTFWHKQIDRIYRGSLEALSGNRKGRLINHLSVEEYLQGVLAAEIPARSPAQALRAQAVAARTLAYRNRNRHKKEGFDFCADVHCQVYQGMSAETPATNRAVEDTRGLIMVFQDQPIEAFYHANSGGCLAADVFGESKYLETKIDAIDKDLPEGGYEQEQWFVTYPDTFSTADKSSAFRWQRVYDREDFSIVFGFPLDEVCAISVEDQGDCFHNTIVNVVTVSGRKRLKGDLAIRNYFDGLRSSAFQLELQLSADNVPLRLFFWGAGFGHGSGMSQAGAIGMSWAGHDYQDILKHYYPGSELKRVY